MKRHLLILSLIVLIAILAACQDSIKADSQTASAMNAPTETPAPVYSETDFLGQWYVSAILDAKGNPLKDSDLQQIDSDFTLELLEDGVYFVYDAEGSVLGQGKFSVADNTLTCSAGGKTTIYLIAENTLTCVSEDGSTTVMSRREIYGADDEEDIMCEDIGGDDEADITDEDTSGDEGADVTD